MGSRSVKFSFTPRENEQIETVIKVPEERRSIIHGIVKDCGDRIVKDAVVKLYEAINHNENHILKPLTHTFTDECGKFVFGPLWANKHYVIKVWINNVKIRELIIHPDEDMYTQQGKCYKKPSKPCEKHNECVIDFEVSKPQIQYEDDDIDD